MKDVQKAINDLFEQAVHQVVDAAISALPEVSTDLIALVVYHSINQYHAELHNINYYAEWVCNQE